MALKYARGYEFRKASQVALVVKKKKKKETKNKNPPANAEDLREADLIPGFERSLEGGGHGNLLQHSCLEKPTDRGAWRATVHGVTQSWTGLKCLGMHTRMSSETKTTEPLASPRFQ